MEGIYTTSVNDSTIDEAPMVYKSLEDIIDVIDESVDLIDIIQVCDRRIGKRRLEEIRDAAEDKRIIDIVSKRLCYIDCKPVD